MARKGHLNELADSLRTFYDQKFTEQQAYEHLKEDSRFGTLRLAKVKTIYRQFKTQPTKKPLKVPVQVIAKKPQILPKIVEKKPVQAIVEKLQAPPKVILKKPFFDFDIRCMKDPDSVAIFAPEIFKYMQSQEPNYQLPSFIKNCIKEANRAIVFNWMVSVQEEYILTHETLYIAIRLFDLYITGNSSTPLNKLQLVAASSLWIASKFEETKPLSIVAIGGFCVANTQADCRKMEIEILKTSRCDFGFPLAYSFLRRYSRLIETDLETLTLARMYLELATHSLQWSLESPSKVSAACLALALEKKKKIKRKWAPILEKYSSYQMSVIEELVQPLEDYVDEFKKSFPKCKNVINKYSDGILFEVAKYLI